MYPTLYRPEVNVEQLADAVYQGRATNFVTSDPSFGCLQGLSFNVWVAPKEFPPKRFPPHGVYLLHAACSTNPRASSTWTFPPLSGPFVYTATWRGKQAPMTLIHPATPIDRNQNARYQGTLDAFDTNDLSFACIMNTHPNVWTDQAAYPWAPDGHAATYVVHATCSDGTDGTWTFSAAPPAQYQYRAVWLGRPMTLTVASLPAGSTPLPAAQGQVRSFTTDDPYYLCFNSGPPALNTFTVADPQYQGRFWVYDQCSTGTWGIWTFTP